MGLLRVGHDWATSLSLFTFMHWKGRWQPTSVFLPGESRGRGSLVGCHLWGRTESDTTEMTKQASKWTKRNFSTSIYTCVYICWVWLYKYTCTPLQYSCLENPMNKGAWQAAVHGVTKSRTQLSDFPFTFHFHALEKEMATHSSVLAWRIPETGEPGGLPSMGSHRVGHNWSDLAVAVAVYTNIYI